jgi:hypothetical protein
MKYIYDSCLNLVSHDNEDFCLTLIPVTEQVDMILADACSCRVYYLNSKSWPSCCVFIYITNLSLACDRLCGLAVRVPSYISRGLGFDFRRYQIKELWVWNGVHSAPLE